MRDQDGLGGFGDAFGGRAVAAVAQVDGHSEVIHLLDGGYACFAEAGVARFEASIAKDAAVVVSKLHDAHA